MATDNNSDNHKNLFKEYWRTLLGFLLLSVLLTYLSLEPNQPSTNTLIKEVLFLFLVNSFGVVFVAVVVNTAVKENKSYKKLKKDNRDSLQNENGDLKVNISFMVQSIESSEYSRIGALFLVTIGLLLAFIVGVFLPFEKHASPSQWEFYVIKALLLIPPMWLFIFAMQQYNTHMKLIASYRHKIDSFHLYDWLVKNDRSVAAEGYKSKAVEQILDNPVHHMSDSKISLMEKAVAQSVAKVNLNQIVDRVVGENETRQQQKNERPVSLENEKQAK